MQVIELKSIVYPELDLFIQIVCFSLSVLLLMSSIYRIFAYRSNKEIALSLESQYHLVKGYTDVQIERHNKQQSTNNDKYKSILVADFDNDVTVLTFSQETVNQTWYDIHIDQDIDEACRVEINKEYIEQFDMMIVEGISALYAANSDVEKVLRKKKHQDIRKQAKRNKASSTSEIEQPAPLASSSSTVAEDYDSELRSIIAMSEEEY